MTRAEELAKKQERNRLEYQTRKEKRLERQREQSRKWYLKNREYQLAKAAATRKRLREQAIVTPRESPPSIESLEAQAPPIIQKNIGRIREDFLKIPILQRPPYDKYLQAKIQKYKINTML